MASRKSKSEVERAWHPQSLNCLLQISGICLWKVLAPIALSVNKSEVVLLSWVMAASLDTNIACIKVTANFLRLHNNNLSLYLFCLLFLRFCHIVTVGQIWEFNFFTSSIMLLRSRWWRHDGDGPHFVYRRDVLVYKGQNNQDRDLTLFHFS